MYYGISGLSAKGSRVMSTYAKSVILVVVFIVGCAASQVLHPLMVPPARAADMQKWEQLCVPWKDTVKDARNVHSHRIETVSHPNGWNPLLAAYGQQGWELVNTTTGSEGKFIFGACFKRPLP
jgi:hypothetical protein